MSAFYVDKIRTLENVIHHMVVEGRREGSCGEPVKDQILNFLKHMKKESVWLYERMKTGKQICVSRNNLITDMCSLPVFVGAKR